MSERDTGVPGRTSDLVVQYGFWRRTWMLLKLLQARLRFIVILAAVGTVVGFWDTINNYYEKWTRTPEAVESATSDVEYFCPMHPYIVRDSAKEKCPICHMDLARRRKGTGEAEPLAAGTVNRVQLSPYREVLAGVQTTEIAYQPLTREITTFGSVEFDETKEEHIAARLKGRIVTLHANYTGQMVEEGQDLAELDIRYSPELMATLEDLRKAQQSKNAEQETQARNRLRIWDLTDKQIKELVHDGAVHTRLTITAPIRGHVIKKYQREGSFVDDGTPLYDVADLKTVWILAQVYEADQSMLRLRQSMRATTQSLPNDVFDGTLDFIYPHLDVSSRTLAVRFLVEQTHEHKLRPGMYATVKITVAPDEMDLFARTVGEDWALENTLDQLAHGLGTVSGPAPTGLEPLLRMAGRLAIVGHGLVLAIPESAVIDTGKMKIVYRQASANVYEGVAVELGPRMAAPGTTLAFYPVLRGLQEGDRVVTNGTFLIDAETRLNPAAGSIYSGGAGKQASSAVAMRPSTPTDMVDEERRLIAAQKLCPVTEKPLGSMGTPVKVTIKNRPVFLCCDGCRGKALASPAGTLKKLEELKAGAGNEAPVSPKPSSQPEEEKIRANLAQLGPGDRAAAEAQKYCIVTRARLGSPHMGVPVKLQVGGQTLFVCCDGCSQEAQESADTPARLEQMKARARVEAQTRH